MVDASTMSPEITVEVDVPVYTKLSDDGEYIHLGNFKMEVPVKIDMEELASSVNQSLKEAASQ